MVEPVIEGKGPASEDELGGNGGWEGGNTKEAGKVTREFHCTEAGVVETIPGANQGQSAPPFA